MPLDNARRTRQCEAMDDTGLRAADDATVVRPLRRARGARDAGAKTVLIVDDDEEIRHVLRVLCETEGLEVVGEASNGVEAVPLALQHQPDFVILDYMLPRLDGEGAAEIMRTITPGSRIVAFSAVLDEQPRWADAYLNKDRITELMPLLHSFIR